MLTPTVRRIKCWGYAAPPVLPVSSLLLFCLAIFSPSSLLSQTPTVEILGSAMDPAGAAVPGASITVANIQTGEARSVKTDAGGHYDIAALPPGQYRLQAHLQAFKAWKVDSVTLASGDKLRLDIHFELGDATQQVTVVAQTPALQSETAEISSLINSQAVQDLPLNGRNFIQLATVTAGAHAGLAQSVTSGNRPDDRRNTSGVSLNGLSDGFNNFLIDGMDDNESVQGFPIVKPSEDAIAEFKVQTNNYSAEYSRTMGGIISLTTKSGTNSLHGSLFEFLRNDKLDATNFFLNRAGQPKSELRQNQWGGSLGGPVIKNKLFFFGDLEQLNLRRGLAYIDSVPTLAMRNGNFAGVATIFDPTTTTAAGARTTFAGGIIPSSRISPAGKNLVNLYPLPNLPGLANNFAYSPVLQQTDRKIDARVDQAVSERTSLFFRYSLQDAPTKLPAQMPDVNIQGSGTISPGGDSGNFAGTTSERMQQVQIHFTHTFTPNLVLQGSLGFSRFKNFTVGANFGKPVSQELGIPGVNLDNFTSGLATIVPSGYTGLGDAAALPLQNINNTFPLSAGAVYIRGGHSLKIGASFTHRELEVPSNANIRPQYSFDANFTKDQTGATPGSGNTIASMLLGFPSATTRSYMLGKPDYRADEIGIYVQDDWHVTKNLTLNLGVRLDIYGALSEKHGILSIPDLSTGKFLIAGQNGVSSTGNIPTALGFAPRFGFAEQLSRHLILRGGFAISFAPDYRGQVVQTVNAPFVAAQSISPSVLTPINSIDQSLPLPTANNPLNPTGAFVAGNFDRPLPYVQQFNLTVQHEFLTGWVASAAYVGALGRHEGDKPQINFPLPGPGSINPRRPFYSIWPNAGNVRVVLNGGNSSYNGLQFNVEHRFNQGLSLLANYTYSHAIDDHPDNQGGEPFTEVFPMVLNNIRLERANSNYDVRHRASFLVNYQL